MMDKKAPLVLCLAFGLALGGCGNANKHSTAGEQNTGNPSNSSQSGASQGGAGASNGAQTQGSAQGGIGSQSGAQGSAQGTGPSNAPQSSTQGAASVTVDMLNTQMNKAGTAELKSQGDTVSITLNVSGLTPGQHGIHIHEAGACQGPDFKSAGGHLNPDSKKHGMDNPEGMHAGDLPNVEADKDGNVKTTITSKSVTLGPGKNISLLDGAGRALVIHAKPDDGKTDPSGNSGDRVVCGVIKNN